MRAKSQQQLTHLSSRSNGSDIEKEERSAARRPLSSPSSTHRVLLCLLCLEVPADGRFQDQTEGKPNVLGYIAFNTNRGSTVLWAPSFAKFEASLAG